MKTLLVMRHAKAIEGDRGNADRERPLAPRGLVDAPRMGKVLRERGILPDVILSSSAKRTRQTTEAVIEAAGLDNIKPQFLSELYALPSENVIDILRGLPDECACVLVVGHNPTMTDLVMRLTGETEAAMPTAAVACIEFAMKEWSEIDDDTGTLKWLLTPKQLEENS